MLAVRPGVRVNLTCPAGRLGDPVEWIFNSSLSAPRSGAPGAGGRLVLEATLPSDSGNYSCHHSGRLAAFLRLVVEGAWRPRNPGVQLAGGRGAFWRPCLATHTPRVLPVWAGGGWGRCLLALLGS